MTPEHLASLCRETPAEMTEHMALHALLHADVTVMITTAQGVIQYVNPAFERRSGYTAREAVGRTPAALKTEVQTRELLERLRSGGPRGEALRAVVANRSKSGEIYHEDRIITALRDANAAISHFLHTGRRLESLPPMQQPRVLAAQTDALDGLADRQRFIDRLTRTIERSAREARRFSLLHIDVDRFRRINDALGHAVGDHVLAAVAQRIDERAGELLGRRLGRRAADDDALARFGGDEFALIVADPSSAAAVERLAADLIRACARPFAIGERSLYAGISIGIAAYPDDGDSAETLVRQAEIAMYRAKSAGRSGFVRFNAQMEKRMSEDLALDNALHNALAKGEFEVFFQAIVSVESHRTVALEALLRWHSPQHGEVPPTRFIPLLEESGLISKVGRWVLHTACTQFAAITAGAQTPATLAVNLSGGQFRDPALLRDIQAILHESGLAPGQLELEITENILIEDAPAAAQTLQTLAALGVRLAIDDFGTGYSSLSYLRRFHIDTLKIDRSFVAEIESSLDARLITEAIVKLAHKLGIEVVAEGVENVDQLALLTEFGCARLQGFLFAHPLPMAELQRQWASAAPPPA